MRSSPTTGVDRTTEDPRENVEAIVEQVLDIVRLLGISQEAEHAKAGLRGRMRELITRMKPSETDVPQHKPFHWTPLKFAREKGGSDVHISVGAKSAGSVGLNYSLSQTIENDGQKVVSNIEIWVDPTGTARELKCKALDKGKVNRLFVNLVGTNQVQSLQRNPVDTGDIINGDTVNITGMGNYDEWQKAVAFLRSYVTPLLPEITKALEKGTISDGLS